MCTKIFKNIYNAIHDKKNKNKKPTRINPNVYEYRMDSSGNSQAAWKQTIPKKVCKDTQHWRKNKVTKITYTINPFL